MSRFLSVFEDFFSKTTDAPVEFGHAAGLAALSTIALGRRWIDRGRAPIVPNLYMLLTAESSRDRKSTSVNIATDLLQEVEPVRVGPTDFTAEGIVGMMREQPAEERRSELMLPIEEFGEYLAVASRSYGQNLTATMCKLYDGQTFERVRSGKKPIRIVSPKLTIFAGVAFSMLEKYADPKEWETGFFARIVWITPTTRRAPYALPPSTPTLERKTALAELGRLAQELSLDERAMSVSSDALGALNAFLADPQMTCADSNDPAIVAQRERLMNALWKFAILYQIDEDPTAQISAFSMERAIALVRQAWRNFLAVYWRVGGTAQNRQINTVWRCVSKSKEISQRDLYKSVHLQISEAQVAINFLLDAGCISRRIEKAPNGKTIQIFKSALDFDDVES